ncbi:MAG: STAS domain-containing protein [Gemmatimonadota bacterium]
MIAAQYVDRETRFATFRQGRSFCVRLDGTLDATTARAVAEQLRNEHHSVRLRLECSTLRAMDPEGTGLLASALLAWAHRRDDRSIDVLNLDPALQRSMAWHPLAALTDPGELLFFAPESLPGYRPSRH